MRKPRVLQLKEELPDEVADALAGKFLDHSHYDTLIQGESVDVLKPDGSPLILFRAKVLAAAVCRAAYPSLRTAAGTAANRGLAAGVVEDRPWGGGSKGTLRVRASDDSVRTRPVKKDGTLSNTNYAQVVPSGIIGFFDRNARFPYCRTTAFNLNYPERWQQALPFIRAVDAVFRSEAPERYTAQLKAVQETSADFVVSGTAFSTITVNRNWRTACHQDAGDYRQGFGVMSALCAGSFEGCYLVFPKYRVAVDMRTRDVCLADVHTWHGNTPLLGIEGAFERISTVMYLREKMLHCGSAREEMVRARNRKRGDRIND